MAAKIFQGGTAGGNWNNNANWVGGAFAIAGDTVTFSANANPCIVNVASACLSIDFTGWTGTTTMTATLVIANAAASGNVTLVAGMGTISGSAALDVRGTSTTLISNGKTWGAALTLNTTSAITLNDNWTVSNTLAFNGNNPIINGFTIFIGGNLLMNSSPTSVTGTTKYEITSNCTITSANTSNSFSTQSFVINSSGTVTFPSGSGGINFASSATLTSVWTYTAGTMVFGTGLVRFGAAVGISFTITTGSSCIFYNLSLYTTIGSTGTITLAANLYLTNIFGGAGNTQTLTVNGFKIYVGYAAQIGSIAWNNSGSSTMTGTTVIEISGTAGTGTWTDTTAPTFKNDIIFNTTGTFDISSTGLKYNTGTITYTAGTVTHTGTLGISGSCTLNTAGITWNTINITGAPTITLNSLWTVTGVTTTTTSVIFAGTSGWSLATFNCATAGVTVTFKNGVTYTTTSAVSMLGSSVSHMIFTSDHATLRAIWTVLNNGIATQSMVYVDGTRIDSSLGQTIWSFGGTLTSTLNWGATGQLYTVSRPFA